MEYYWIALIVVLLIILAAVVYYKREAFTLALTELPLDVSNEGEQVILDEMHKPYPMQTNAVAAPEDNPVYGQLKSIREQRNDELRKEALSEQNLRNMIY